jgi:uncharacterized protein
MENNNVHSTGNSKIVAWILFGLFTAAILYFGLPQYTKYKAKKDLEDIGITFSEQKFVEKACDGDSGSVALFIRAGMNINVLAVPPNSDGKAKSALHCAASTGNLTLAKSLLDLGADVNLKDDASNTPLYSASGNIRFANRNSETPNNNLELVKLLIERGADINAGGLAGPPLLTAIQARSYEVFDYLLKKGANVKVKNKEEMTPVMLLAYTYNNKDKESQNRVMALIKAGVDVNERNKSGQTALMIAVNNRSKEMMRTLLENGADPSIEDKNGSSILNYAISDPESLKIFLDKGADPNVTVQGQPLLHRAVMQNDMTLQLLLANKKTDLNIKSTNGDNVLHVLSRMPNQAQKMSLLIASSASVNAINNQMETPLIRAVQSRNIAAAIVLLDAKASVNARDASGRTALYFANQGVNIDYGRGYAYGYAAPAESAPMAPSDMDIREIMRNNDNAAMQRYLATIKTRNGQQKYGRSATPRPAVNNPMVELLLKHGATL